jgi:hypothetical protein
MKNMEDLPENIFDWINEYAFSELNEAKRKEVLEFLTETEYEDFRMVLSNFKDLEEERDTEIQTPAFDFNAVDLQTASIQNKLNYYRFAIGFLVLLIGAVLVWKSETPTLDFKETESATISSSSGVQPSPELINFQIQTMKQTIESNERRMGVSLADENYPDDLILGFPGGGLPANAISSSL